MNNAVNDVRRRMAAVTDVDPDSVLITFYVDNELPPEERARVEARMAVDAEFRRDVETTQAIWALPAWVGVTKEDEEWLAHARAHRPTVTEARRARTIATVRSARWLQAAAAIIGIVTLSGLGVEAVQVALGSRDAGAPRVATSAPPVHAPRPAANTPSSPSATKPSAAEKATRSAMPPSFKPDSATPVSVAAVPDHALPSAAVPPVVVATTKSAPHVTPLGHVTGERPCVEDPVLSALAAKPDSEAPIKDVGKLLRIFAPRPRAGAISIGRTDLPVGGAGQGPAQPPKFCGDTTRKPTKP